MSWGFMKGTVKSELSCGQGGSVTCSQRWPNGSYIFTCITTVLSCRVKLSVAADSYCTVLYRSLNIQVLGHVLQ